VKPLTVTVLRLIGGAVAALGVIAALMLFFLPLSPEGEAFCGPGAQSDNAVQVLWDPSVVNQTDGSEYPQSDPWQSADQQAAKIASVKKALSDVCTTQAWTRAVEAGGSVLAGLTVALVFALISIYGQRRT
jgi:hypothetical protein